MLKVRDYQQQVADAACCILKEHNLVYLCLEMRVGKNVISALTCEQMGYNNVLFVSKKKALPGFQKDSSHFKPTFTIVNYEQLHNVIGNFDAVIIDEAHNIGAYPKPSVRADMLKKLCKNLPIIYLSGTPSPETFSQLYHQFWVSSYSPFAKYSNFYKWFANYGIKRQIMVNSMLVNDYKKTIDFLQEIKHLMITFTQEEAGFESYVKETVIRLPMPEVVGKSISLLKKNKVLKTKAGYTIIADGPAVEMQKISQFCGGTIKVDDGSAITIDNSKCEYILNNFNTGKYAVFYQYIAEGALLNFMLLQKAKVYTDAEQFQQAPAPAYFLGQFQSIKEGVDLSTADAIINYNIGFSYTTYIQSRSRLQTKDRVKDANVYWLFFDGGIEEKIYKTVLNKKDFTAKHYEKDSN